MTKKERVKLWFLRGRIKKAKSRLHRVADVLYIIRYTNPETEEKINAFLDDELYPLLSSLDRMLDEKK